MVQIDHLDHLVLTVQDIQRTCDFYSRVLGMQVITFAGGRKALRFGNEKINLHQVRHEFEPKAARPTPGSADLCLITKTPMAAVVEELKQDHVSIEAGPVTKHGALGDITSVYVRDPDQNLIEISNY